MAAKKKEASVISGREEVIDRGLFGEGAALSRDPEDTITRVAKSNPYTGEYTVFDLGFISRPSLPAAGTMAQGASVWYGSSNNTFFFFLCVQVNLYLTRANSRVGSLLK